MNENDRVQKTEVQESVLKGLPDELLKRVQRKAGDLVQNDESFNLIMTMLITSQQLYQLARYSLQRECAKEGISWKEGIEEFIIQAAKDASMKPIQRTDVLRKVQGPVLKYMTEEVKMQIEEERAEHMKTQRDIAKARAETPVYVNNEKKGFKLERSKLTLFTGTITQINVYFNTLKPQNCTSIIFDTKPGKNIAEKKNAPPKQTLTVGVNRWNSLANSPAKLSKQMDEWAAKMQGGVVDVVMVSHSHFLHSGGVSGRSTVRQAEDGLKALLRWASNNQCSIVAGVATDLDDADSSEEIQKVFGEHHSLIELE